MSKERCLPKSDRSYKPATLNHQISLLAPPPTSSKHTPPPKKYGLYSSLILHSRAKQIILLRSFHEPIDSFLEAYLVLFYLYYKNVSHGFRETKSHLRHDCYV